MSVGRDDKMNLIGKQKSSRKKDNIICISNNDQKLKMALASVCGAVPVV